MNPCPVCGAHDGEPHAATCRRGLALFRRVTDNAITYREVTKRVAGIVHYIESGMSFGRRFGPRYRSMPAATFSRWERGADVVPPDTRSMTRWR